MAEAKYLYIMKKKKGNLIKIGIAKDPLSRANAIRLNSGEEINVMYRRWVKDAAGIEKALHKHFRMMRKEGEFFCMKWEDVAVVADDCIDAVEELEVEAEYIAYCERLPHDEVYMYDRAHRKMGKFSYFEWLGGVRYYVKLRGDFVSDDFDTCKELAMANIKTKTDKLNKHYDDLLLTMSYTEYLEKID